MTGLLVQPARLARVALALLCVAAFAALPAGADARSKKPRSSARVSFKVPSPGLVAVVKFNVTVKARRGARRRAPRAPKVKLRGKGLPSDLYVLAQKVRLKKPRRTFAYTVVLTRVRTTKSSARGWTAQGPTGYITITTGPYTTVSIKRSSVKKLVNKVNNYRRSTIKRFCDDLGKGIEPPPAKFKGEGYNALRRALIHVLCGKATAEDHRLLQEAGIEIVEPPPPATSDKDGDGKPDAQDSCVDRAGPGTANGCPSQCSSPCVATTQGAPANHIKFSLRWSGPVKTLVVTPPSGKTIVNRADPSGCTGAIENNSYRAQCNTAAGAQMDFMLELSPAPVAGDKVGTSVYDDLGLSGSQTLDVL